jgi:hypothetical protein
VTTRFHHYYTPYQNIIYDDLLNLFCDVNYISVIILSPISSSHATYDENGNFVMEYVPFGDQSLQRHEQIVTDKHFSSSAWWHADAAGRGQYARRRVRGRSACFAVQHSTV